MSFHVDPKGAPRGSKVVLSFEWRCETPPGPGWMLLTHLGDPSGTADNLDFNGPLRARTTDGKDQINGPGHWEAGKTYRESIDYEIPDWAKGPLTVIVGIFKGPDRLHIVSGPNDGHNLAAVGQIQVE